MSFMTLIIGQRLAQSLAQGFNRARQRLLVLGDKPASLDLGLIEALLGENGLDCPGDLLLTTLWHLGQDVMDEVKYAPLVFCPAEGFLACLAQTSMGIGNDQIHTTHAAFAKTA